MLYFNTLIFKDKIKIENEAYINKIFIDIMPYIGGVEYDSIDFINKDL